MSQLKPTGRLQRWRGGPRVDAAHMRRIWRTMQTTIASRKLTGIGPFWTLTPVLATTAARQARSTTTQTQAGRTDHDSDSATPCIDCAPGTFSGQGEFTCHECEPGQYDHDANDPNVELSAATPCERCNIGQYSGRSETTCYDCQAGKTDHDRNPASPCHECGLGQYMPSRTAGCVPGNRLYVQYQLDPRQSLVDACRGGCIDCPPGWTDLDLDPDTPCVRCGDDTYAPIPATRGQCPLCSEIPNSRTVVDADHNASTPCAHVQSEVVFETGLSGLNHEEEGR